MKLICLSTIIFFTIATKAQEFVKMNFNCSKHSLDFILPNGFKNVNSDYEEGFFSTYFWVDKSIIELKCGSLSIYPFLSDDINKIISIDTLDNRIVTKGLNVEDDLYWRVDNYLTTNITIAYYHIRDKKLEIFEKSLNSINISTLTKD